MGASETRQGFVSVRVREEGGAGVCGEDDLVGRHCGGNKRFPTLFNKSKCSTAHQICLCRCLVRLANTRVAVVVAELPSQALVEVELIVALAR